MPEYPGPDAPEGTRVWFRQNAVRSPLDGRAPSSTGAVAGELDPTSHLPGGARGAPPGPGGTSATIGMGPVPPPIHNTYPSGMRRSDEQDAGHRVTYRPNRHVEDTYALPDDGKGYPKEVAGWYPLNYRGVSEPTLNIDINRPRGDGGAPVGSYWSTRLGRTQFVRAYNPNREIAADDGLGGRKVWQDPGAQTPRGLEPESEGPRRNRSRHYPQTYGNSVPAEDPSDSYAYTPIINPGR